MKFLIKAGLGESAKVVEINVPGDDPLIAEILAEVKAPGVLPVFLQGVLQSGTAFLAFLNGKVRLNDGRRASHYCLQDGSTLYLMASRVLPDYELLYEFEPAEREELVRISDEILSEEVSWDDGAWSLYEVVRDSESLRLGAGTLNLGTTSLAGLYGVIDDLDEGQAFDAKLYSPDLAKRKQAFRDQMLLEGPPRVRGIALKIVNTLSLTEDEA